MSETQFTPGPWEVWEGHYSVYATGPNTENERGYITGTRRPVCEMLEYTNSDEAEDFAEMAANAQAIAAVPDLLAACKKAAELGYTMGDLGNSGVDMPDQKTMIEWSEALFALYEQCEQAIAKATGGAE